MQSMPRNSRSGLTLIELLIVLTIISLLISLAIPAVQAARETSRNAACRNNLRQLGLALAGFESSRGRFPSGITAVAQGPLAFQPKVRLRNYLLDILPYCEQTSMLTFYDLEQDFCAEANQRVLRNRLPWILCPSAPGRPPAASSSFDLANILSLSTPDDEALERVLAALAKSYRCDSFEGAPGDYTVVAAVTAALARATGQGVDPGGGRGPYPVGGAFPLPLARWDEFRAKALHLYFGQAMLEFSASLRAAEFTDGLGNTLLLAEDAGRPESWTRGVRRPESEPIRTAPWGHPQNLITVGAGWDERLPAIQGQNNQDIYSFHTAGANVVFADGHVVTLSADTDPRVLVSLVTPSAGDQVDSAQQ